MPVKLLISLFFVLLLSGPASTARADAAAVETRIAKGGNFYKLGHYERAAQSWEKALQNLTEKKDRGRYIDVSIDLARAYQAIGYHKRALAVLDRAKPMAAESDDRRRRALLLNSLADLYLSLGRTDEMVKYLQQGVTEARLGGDPQVEARVLNNLGNVFTMDGNWKEAFITYEEYR